MKKWLLAMGLVAAAAGANADCECRCVAGQMRPLCTSSLDIPPICPLTICPLTPPSIAPIQPLQLPPLGTQSCRQVQVMDPVTRQYQWRTVCQ